jgi:hypothetical protein
VNGSGPLETPGKAVLKVVNSATGAVVKSATATLKNGVDTDITVTYNPNPGVDYDYIIIATGVDVGAHILVHQLTKDQHDDRKITWEILQAGVTIAQSFTRVNGQLNSRVVGHASFVSAGGPLNYVFRATDGGGQSRNVFLDKVVYRPVSLNGPRVMELGLDDRIWITDYAAAIAPNVGWWDPPNDKWQMQGTFGAAGDVISAMAHSDHFEFFANSTDKKVYHVTRAGAIAAHTNAVVDAIVGLTVGGNRLLILTESQANGTRIYSHPLEGAAATPTLLDTGNPGNPGVTADTEHPRRMAATEAGAVFFANMGPDCWVYLYNGTAVTPLAKMPTGFRGQGIAYASGVTLIAGAFPAVDAAGATQRRPALFSVPSSGGLPQELALQLWHQDDISGSSVVDMQFYGSDLWLGVEYPGDGTAPAMRLWRVSLRDPISAYLEQEIATDQTQTAGHLRGIGITWQQKFIMWSLGSPMAETTSYAATGDLASSLYNFGLTETKELCSLDVVADIPAGTSVILGYSCDGATPVDVVFTEPGRQLVSSPDTPVTFRNLGIDIALASSDPTLSPTVYEGMARAYMVGEANLLFTAILQCFNPTNGDQAYVWDANTGGPLTGAVGHRNIHDLAERGTVVEFEDRFSDPANPHVGIGTITDLNADSIHPGESFVSVQILERSPT